MNILCLDYGLAKVGVAISTAFLAEPYSVIKYSDNEILVQEIKRIVENEGIEKIIVGMSEGKTATVTREFIEKLRKLVSTPIEEVDETLSTYDAQRLSIEANIKQSKRKDMEDAFAATVILQGYIDSKP